MVPDGIGTPWARCHGFHWCGVLQPTSPHPVRAGEESLGTQPGVQDQMLVSLRIASGKEGALVREGVKRGQVVTIRSCRLGNLDPS
jgi:hypothetical protein